ncbi:MAG: hypothetical protein KAV45_13590 [Calditrichia bacterium]|nr:hypothetical protein [Calditrichia bacterium]
MGTHIFETVEKRFYFLPGKFNKIKKFKIFDFNLRLSFLDPNRLEDYRLVFKDIKTCLVGHKTIVEFELTDNRPVLSRWASFPPRKLRAMPGTHDQRLRRLGMTIHINHATILAVRLNCFVRLTDLAMI